jgi:dipeptidyl aminopeptidase/acylaminoacyl peptidase
VKLPILLLAGLFLMGVAQAAPPIEAYGNLPEIRSLAISPNGKHFAYLIDSPEVEGLIVHELGVGAVGGARTDKVKARFVEFASPDYAILRASETTSVFGFRGRFEHSAAISYDIPANKLTVLLKKTEDLFPAQTGLGRILGVSRDGRRVFMPAFMGRGNNPGYDLLSVDLRNGRGRVVTRGKSDTTDWIVKRDGTVLAREDYDNGHNKYAIRTRLRGSWEKIFVQNVSQIPLSLVGVNPDQSALIVVDRTKENDFSAVYELSFDGKFSAPVFSRDDAAIEDILTDIQRTVIGVRYSGLFPEYEFYDKSLGDALAIAQDYFGGDAVRLESWTDDLNELVLYVAGSSSSGIYYIYNRAKNSMTQAARSRPQIAPEDIGPVFTIEYPARDKLNISGILTLPPGSTGAEKNLPLIVLPHGGPESYDEIGFDWLAQFFASRGYIVLQPNFRGSSGFGAEFRDAGRGEWGRKMQDDITDGVKALINTGRADPERICIVGASYGGYAALAGGAFTPSLYKCVAAIAPVSDLPRMLIDEKQDHGTNHWVYDYWTDVIGDLKAERKKLESISPVNFAADFQAPVLLIHGKDDTVVPMRQSTRMERALINAGKPVELIRLKGEDHWLSTSETRLETLKALDAFVSKHLGAQ